MGGMTHQAVIYLRASDFAGARQSKPRPVKGANDTARQGRLLALLSHFASMSSVTGSAQALGISESAVRFDLCLANNLSETQLVRLGGLQDGDAVELTDAAYELLPERLAGLFARYLDAPAAWQGPFRGFHRRRAMLNRLATRIAVRNRLFGRVGALRLKVGRVDVEVDLGERQEFTVRDAGPASIVNGLDFKLGEMPREARIDAFVEQDLHAAS